jgi:hypothetical protein
MYFGISVQHAAVGFLRFSTMPVLIGVALVLSTIGMAEAQNQPQAKAPARVYQTASSRGAELVTCMARARALYRARRYAEAADYFQQAVKKEAAGAGGLLWVAHCQYALGNVREAVGNYRQVADTYIGTQESKQAAQYIARLDPTGKIQASGAGFRSATIIGLAGGGSSSSGSLQDRIEIVKPVIGHPELSESTISLVKENIRQLPAPLQSLLQERGIRFCITTSLVDKYPGMAYQEGRGYDGHTYKSCPGMFKDNTVIICERFVDEASNEVGSAIAPGQITDTFYHEVGHAIDACLGNCSSKDDYRHAYYLDMARIPADAANRLAYFMQKSLAGQQESCGEIIAVCLSSDERNAQDIKTYFPETMALIQKKLTLQDVSDDSRGQIAGRSTGHRI